MEYVWRVNYFSNPDVSHLGLPTGTATENNAQTIRDNMVRRKMSSYCNISAPKIEVVALLLIYCCPQSSGNDKMAVLQCSLTLYSTSYRWHRKLNFNDNYRRFSFCASQCGSKPLVEYSTFRAGCCFQLPDRRRYITTNTSTHGRTVHHASAHRPAPD